MNTYRSLRAIQSALQADHIAYPLLNPTYNEFQDQQDLNAFLEVYEKEALASAQAVDDKLKEEGTAGRLAGIVIGIKDNICYKGHCLSAPQKILDSFDMFSATVVERLLAEDAIIIGRLNCDEFAMGSTNENSAHGPVLNLLTLIMFPESSNGGSAATGDADLCLASLGSDTGGSIRLPASFCGVMGCKPTYGRVSRWGLIVYLFF